MISLNWINSDDPVIHEKGETKCFTVPGTPGNENECKLLSMEMGDIPSVARLLDLEMLVITGGRERTEVEFRGLLDLSGFGLVQIIRTVENIFIIEAAPKCNLTPFAVLYHSFTGNSLLKKPLISQSIPAAPPN